MKLSPNLLRQVGAYCIKRFKKRYIYLVQHYGTAIEPVPFNETLHEKRPCYIITKTDSECQECCVAELPGTLPKMTYVLLLKSGCFAKTFEFQPSLEQEGVFGTQPHLVTSGQNKHNPPPSPPQSDFSTKSFFLQSTWKGLGLFQLILEPCRSHKMWLS